MSEELKKNKDEIIWNLINSGLAGLLVFLGSLSNGVLSWKGLIFAVIAAGIVATTKFSDYWKSEQKEYTRKVFCFVR